MNKEEIHFGKLLIKQSNSFGTFDPSDLWPSDFLLPRMDVWTRYAEGWLRPYPVIGGTHLTTVILTFDPVTPEWIVDAPTYEVLGKLLQDGTNVPLIKSALFLEVEEHFTL